MDEKTKELLKSCIKTLRALLDRWSGGDIPHIPSDMRDDIRELEAQIEKLISESASSDRYPPATLKTS